MSKPLKHSSSMPSPRIINAARRARKATKSKEDSFDASIPELEQLRALRAILRMNPKERTSEMLKKLYDYTITLKFFMKMKEEYSEEVCHSCCMYITYEYHPPNSFICRQGEKGTKFYIILNGSAKVLIENQEHHLYKQQVGELGSGDTFGERAIMLGIPRAASIQCQTPCHLAVLNASDYRKILDNMFEEKFESIVEVLKKLPILQGFSRNYVQRLGYYFRQKKFKKGQFVYKEKDKNEEIYIIQEGEFRICKKVEVTVKSPKAFPEKSTLKRKQYPLVTQLASLSKGEMFGEEDILSDSNLRTTSSYCHSDLGKVLAITKDDFFKHIVVTEEGKAAMRQRNLQKSESRSHVMENNLKLKKMHIGVIPLTISSPEPMYTRSASPSPKLLKHPPTPSLPKIKEEFESFNHKSMISNDTELLKTRPSTMKNITIEKRKSRQKKPIKIEIRNIHTWKLKAKEPLTPIDILQEQGKLTLNELKQMQYSVITDAWEEKMLHDGITSRRRMKRLSATEHHMFRLSW
ncbi:unnamed protein product [Blepharisma stoltei]|uniref:Cyclic nucleotide-binding domain-containing protein n=1 Tax=Blepharisma stoltei TaxID=1481888 RepID=A0AAU9J9T5_9CILI|nr:unnamed protein product [Blepharisma stoltei]